MWTKENRGRYDRSRLRYSSDLNDEEWASAEPLDRIHHTLYVRCRDSTNREPGTSAAIIDSQSVKSAVDALTLEFATASGALPVAVSPV